VEYTIAVKYNPENKTRKSILCSEILSYVYVPGMYGKQMNCIKLKWK